MSLHMAADEAKAACFLGTRRCSVLFNGETAKTWSTGHLFVDRIQALLVTTHL